MTISADRIYEGYECGCDTPGCTGWDAFHTASEAATETRLRGEGWYVENGLHLCPKCVEARLIQEHVDTEETGS